MHCGKSVPSADSQVPSADSSVRHRRPLFASCEFIAALQLPPSPSRRSLLSRRDAHYRAGTQLV